MVILACCYPMGTFLPTMSATLAPSTDWAYTCANLNSTSCCDSAKQRAKHVERMLYMVLAGFCHKSRDHLDRSGLIQLYERNKGGWSLAAGVVMLDNESR